MAPEGEDGLREVAGDRVGDLRPLAVSLLAAMQLLVASGAHAQATATGQRAYWCQDPSGREVMQLESCAPGKEVRPSEPVGARGVVKPKPSSSAAAPAAAS